MKTLKKALILTISLIGSAVWGQGIGENPLEKLEPFIGDWTFTEYIKSDQKEDFKMNNAGMALIYFTRDSTTVVVDEKGENGHLFRGIHTYNFQNDFYNNFSNRTDGGINWSHYRWNKVKNRAIWYEGQTINPNNPGDSRLLSKDNFSAEWFSVNPKEHVFQVEILDSGRLIYARKVVYKRK